MINRAASFCLIGIGFFLLQCNDEVENPHYPPEPEIAFKKIEFIETPTIQDYDTLKLTIRYIDGDSDLGLDPFTSEDINFPFNQVFYFLEDGTGDTTKVYSSPVYSNQPPYTGYDLLNTLGLSGKLVTGKTQLKDNYNYLPEYNENLCVNYSLTQLLVPKASNVIDDSYNILDTIYDDYILIEEPFLYQRNENHFNILIDFYTLNDGEWTEYDLFENFCFNFDGRFPFFGEHTGTFKSGPYKIKAKTPWNGEITYSMPNASFLAIFGDKTLKLRITIKDRALHTSNVIETPPFTLEGI